MTTRTTLGAIVLLLLLAGSAIFLAPGVDESTRLAAGAAVRVGLIFGAIWVALPAMGDLKPRTLILLGVVAAAFAYRPRLALWLLPVAAVMGVLTVRSRRRTGD